VRCGTVVVPQNRRTPTDASLQSVVLPVVVYAMPGATGTPLILKRPMIDKASDTRAF